MKKKNLNKVREMKGVKVGRGSAGRIGKRVGVRMKRERGGYEPYYGDVARACSDWLREHGEKVGGFREMMISDIQEARARA